MLLCDDTAECDIEIYTETLDSKSFRYNSYCCLLNLCCKPQALFMHSNIYLTVSVYKEYSLYQSCSTCGYGVDFCHRLYRSHNNDTVVLVFSQGIVLTFSAVLNMTIFNVLVPTSCKGAISGEIVIMWHKIMT